MASEPEIIDRQKVVVVHDKGEMGRSFRTHFTLFVIQLTHLFVEPASPFLDSFRVHYIITVTADRFHLGNQRFNFFIAQYRADPAASGLLQANQLTFQIIKSEVQHPDERVFGCSTGSNNGDIHLVLFIVFL